MLNTSDPTTVPMPMSPCVMKVPMMLKNNSGTEVPMAMMVAPATSGDMCNAVKSNQIKSISVFFQLGTEFELLPSARISREGTKKSSTAVQIINMEYAIKKKWTTTAPIAEQRGFYSIK